MLTQTINSQISVASGEEDHRGVGRIERLAALTVSLRGKANTLLQLNLAGQDCFEQWQQLQRIVTRNTWLWMALEFDKEEYRLAYHASI